MDYNDFDDILPNDIPWFSYDKCIQLLGRIQGNPIEYAPIFFNREPRFWRHFLELTQPSAQQLEQIARLHVQFRSVEVLAMILPSITNKRFFAKITRTVDSKWVEDLLELLGLISNRDIFEAIPAFNNRRARPYHEIQEIRRRHTDQRLEHLAA